MLRKKIVQLISVSLLWSSVSLLVACGGGGGDSGSGDSSSPTSGSGDSASNGGDNTSVPPVAAVTFNVQDMNIAYTTDTSLSEVPQFSTKSVKTASNQASGTSSKLPIFADSQSLSTRFNEIREVRTRHTTKETNSFNMVAINQQGIAQPAYTSTVPLRVMFSVRATTTSTEATVSAKNELYIALNSQSPAGDSTNYAAFIAEKNCAIFRVSLDDNSYDCLLPGVEAAPIHGSSFGKFDGASNKTIQFDELGNIYVQGYPFDVSGDRITKRDTTRLYKVTIADYQVSAITQDNEDVAFFSVLQSGEPVVLLKRTNGNDFVMFRKSQERLNLSSGSHDYFVNRDSHRALIYGSFSDADKNIRFVRSSDSGIERAALDYSRRFTTSIDGKDYQDLSPQRIIVADDGYIYVVYSAREAVEGKNALLLYQVLPFKKEVVASIPVTGNWWDWMKNRAIQIKKGVLYYASQVDKANVGKADVITMVRLRDGEKVNLFASGNKRYRIDSWKARGDQLFFSGIDLGANTVVQGSIDTKKVAQQVDWTGSFETTYSVQASSSASRSSATIQDIEILSPQQPLHDPGGQPEIDHQSSTEYSGYFSFSKYMKRQEVEDKLGMTRNNDGTTIAYFPVWVYQNLHLIYDTLSGLSNDETEGLAANTGEYTLAIEQVSDAYGWSLPEGSYSYEAPHIWGKLNDTGITWGGNDSSGNNSTCTSNIAASQDCHQGRDAQAAAGTLKKVGAGHGGFDFTKLGADGQALTIQNGTWSNSGTESSGTKWSCVKDNYTKLVWEVKTNVRGIHHKDNCLVPYSDGTGFYERFWFFHNGAYLPLFHPHALASHIPKVSPKVSKISL